MEGILIIIACVVAFFVSTVVTKKVATKIYIITGYNGFGDLHKMLCAAVFIILVGVSIIFPDELGLAYLSLIPIGILVLLNLKAKKPAYIVTLTLLQIVYAISWFLFLLVRIVFKFLLHADFSFSQDLKPLEASTLERADYVAKQKGYIDANDWAAKEGLFNDAHAAYKEGFFNGKLY